MQRLFVLMSGWLLLVPVLGLSSACSKKVDEWEMKEPRVIGTGISPIRIEAASSRVLPMDAQIDFSKSSFDSITISAECSLNEKSFSEKHTLSFQPYVPLKSLWPSSMWSKLSNADLNASKCNFAFETTNSKSSTQDFNLEAVQLDTFENQKTVRLLAASAANNSFGVLNLWMSLIKNADHYNMKCGDQMFDLEATHASASQLQDLIVKSNLEGVQSCSLRAYGKVDSSSLPDFEITPEVKVRLNPVTLKVEAQAFSSGNGSNSVVLAKYQVVNSTDEASYVRLPTRDQDLDVVLNTLYPPSGVSYPRGIQNVILHSVVSGGSQISNANGLTIIQIPAHSTVELSLSTNVTEGQDLNFLLQSPTLSLSAHLIIAGFDYGLKSTITIEQATTEAFDDAREIYRIVGGSGSRPNTYRF